MADLSQEELRLFATEVNGETARECLREDVKLAADLGKSGYIYESADSVLNYYRARYFRQNRTVIKLLLIDGGRAACSLEPSWLQDNGSTTILLRQRKVCVIDLDENCLIKRIEYRDTSERISATKGGHEEMKNGAADSEEDAVVMMEHFEYQF
ncbi:hypothetical protein BDP55DRAFT_739128 [Colletotrichum godetiae]|uniref:Uncharacterized protein n=1 Tax=Colletotrichum godetiae TaxID=1209918 RepID=A0AAJ0A5D8_9PEZI|nr:uncharacterized protein BDP55DRAFT_739128 [Colletotrichum godetiae]KAK1656803.1 hypothetical protein BDP55DRAFT_739128 [Colletotrichum godetiae]